MNFLKANALPGPDSKVTGIIQLYGPESQTRFITVQKTSRISQIPGLTYGYQIVANLPRASTWEANKLSEAQIDAIDAYTISAAVHDPKVSQTGEQLIQELGEGFEELHQYCVQKRVD